MTRRGTKIFLSLLFMLSCGAMQSESHATIIDRVEAAVNSEIILLSDILHFRKTAELRQQLDPLFKETALATKGGAALDSEITQYLIDERLILQQFPVDDQTVEQKINTIQAENRLDRQKLIATLASQDFSFQNDYFELIRTSIAKINLIDRDIRTKVYISDDDVKNFFYNQYQNANSQFSYQIKMITITSNNYNTAEDAIQIANRALDALKSGESFEDVAKRFSDAPSAQTGGDLGLLSEDEMSPAIRDEIKKLRVGQLSPLLGSSSDQFFILKLLDIRSGQEDKLQKMREEIRNNLAITEYQRQISLWLERQRQTAYIHIAGEPSIPKGALPANYIPKK